VSGGLTPGARRAARWLSSRPEERDALTLTGLGFLQIIRRVTAASEPVQEREDGKAENGERDGAPPEVCIQPPLESRHSHALLNTEILRFAQDDDTPKTSTRCYSERGEESLRTGRPAFSTEQYRHLFRNGTCQALPYRHKAGGGNPLSTYPSNRWWQSARHVPVQPVVAIR